MGIFPIAAGMVQLFLMGDKTGCGGIEDRQNWDVSEAIDGNDRNWQYNSLFSSPILSNHSSAFLLLKFLNPSERSRLG